MSPRRNWEFPAYTSEWQNIRRRVIWRDGSRRQECGSSHRPLHVHHRLSLSQGGSDDFSNLVTLCHGCHSQRHPHMDGADADKVVASKLRTFSPQLGVTSAQLRAYEERHGIIDTPYTKELRTPDELLALEEYERASTPTAVRQEQPTSRRQGHRRSLAMFLFVAVLLMLNAAV